MVTAIMTTIINTAVTTIVMTDIETNIVTTTVTPIITKIHDFIFNNIIYIDVSSGTSRKKMKRRPKTGFCIWQNWHR